MYRCWAVGYDAVGDMVYCQECSNHGIALLLKADAHMAGARPDGFGVLNLNPYAPGIWGGSNPW